MRFYFLSLVAMLVLATTAKAEIIGTLTYKGSKYAVDVIRQVKNDTLRYEVWLRESAKGPTEDDMKLFELRPSMQPMESVNQLSFQAKEVEDDGKFITGRKGDPGNALCAASATNAAKTKALVCTTAWTYMLDFEAAVSIQNFSGVIGKKLSKNKDFISMSATTGLKDAKVSEVIAKAINYMCDDIKADTVPDAD